MLSMEKPRRSVQLALLAMAAAMCCGAAQADTKRSRSPAQYPRIQYDGSSPMQKSFSFTASKALLNQRGEWAVEGTLAHNGLLCGDYEVGMRFGVAKEGCTDVEWISAEQYVVTQSLCNNATVPYRGVMQEPELTESFDQITCAEQIVRCSGTCK